MSIYFSGRFGRSQGLISSITKQLKLMNLKPVKRIQVQFDPFHQNAVTAREFLFHISTPRVTETNLNCIIKPNVVCDRSEPEIKIDLIEEGSIRFLANNLSVLEILEQINKHVSLKVPPEPDAELQTVQKKKVKRRIK